MNLGSCCSHPTDDPGVRCCCSFKEAGDSDRSCCCGLRSDWVVVVVDTSVAATALSYLTRFPCVDDDVLILTLLEHYEYNSTAAWTSAIAHFHPQFSSWVTGNQTGPYSVTAAVAQYICQLYKTLLATSRYVLTLFDFQHNKYQNRQYECSHGRSRGCGQTYGM